MPAARAAAHVPRKLQSVVPPPGVDSDQVSLSPWIKRRSPPGDQGKEGTRLPSQSLRGDRAALSIPHPRRDSWAPLVPSGSQPLRGAGEVAVARMEDHLVGRARLKRRMRIEELVRAFPLHGAQ